MVRATEPTRVGLAEQRAGRPWSPASQRVELPVEVTPINGSDHGDRSTRHTVQDPKITNPETVQGRPVTLELLGAGRGRNRVSGQRCDFLDDPKTRAELDLIEVPRRALGEDDREVRQHASAAGRHTSRAA